MQDRGLPEASPPLFSSKALTVEASIEGALSADRLALEHVARIQVATDQAFRDLVRGGTTIWEAARYVDPVDSALRDFYREAGLRVDWKEAELS
jgi:hypothetical protein